MAKKILIVNNEPDLLRIITFRIQKMGYDVIIASDAVKALEMIKSHVPGLILLDINMPNLSGPEVCKNMKAEENLKKIPVIFLAAASTNIEEKAKEAGAQDYLIKPFDLEVLVKKIQKLIE
ncbi:MAG: hypothetical protein A2166_05350 [Omnitrophica WOR_2 bacterium RBG_13_41_10]|nr:MAG: hypothetical protein A2166_05350 [Omnitrophica WOR_2 bacterium RBG_13_41_10]